MDRNINQRHVHLLHQEFSKAEKKINRSLMSVFLIAHSRYISLFKLWAMTTEMSSYVCACSSCLSIWLWLGGLVCLRYINLFKLWALAAWMACCMSVSVARVSEAECLCVKGCVDAWSWLCGFMSSYGTQAYLNYERRLHGLLVMSMSLARVCC